VLDTLPGEVRAGGPGRQDHPADLIATLRRLPLPIADRNAVVDYLLQSGDCCICSQSCLFLNSDGCKSGN
jgi:hypothetical protein